jgi:ABC-type multidrug transport system fused ATPase/permease subunit
MLRAMQNPLTTNRVVMTYALLSLGFRWAYTQLEVLRNWYGRRCYERSRGEVTTIIFGKALSRTAVSGLKRISNSKETQREQCPTPVATLKPGEVTHRLFRSFDRIANAFRPQNNTGPPIDRQPASIGTILNLFRGDVHEIAQHFWEVDKLVKGPVGLILASVLVWKFLGPSCFLGILSLALGQIVSSMLTRSLIKTDRSWKKATDHRLQLTSQFIEVIRYLRWYGWQEHWLKLVGDSRQKELTALVKFKLLQIIIRFINVLSSSLLPAIALYAYTLIEKRPLTIDIIFPALQLFRILDSRLTAIPDLFSIMTNVSVSLRRIEDFMDEAEIVTSQPTKQNEDIDLRLEDCSFAWPESKQPILKEVNLTFSTGLTVVHGKVGAGKTAFLQALLGEMDLLTGVYHAPNQPLGYCAQTPWLQSMSIRDNILFFAAYEQEFYHNVLDACELNPDLKLLADGDSSLIGENGIGLSGGQRARVALARAVYSRPKILLLDDPLSALDDSTAESIARKLFGGSLLRTCTIVLVTYRVELIRPYASQFLEVTDSRIDVRETGQPSSRASYDDIGANDESQQSTETAKEFIENEQCSKFGVRARVYWVYAKAGGLQWWLLQVIALLISQLLELLYVWYTKMWGEAYNSVDPFKFAASTSFAPISRFPPPEKNVEPWLLAFLLISVLQPLSALSFMVLETVVVYRVAKRLFMQVMHKVASATFQYYDVTPSGRLMNRLTTDMSNIDGKTSTQFVRFLLYLIALALSLAAIASIAPLFLIAAFALVIVFIYTFQIYLPTSQSLRRLECVSLSPLFTHFGDLLQGLTTVRAFKAQEQFQSRFFAAVDQYQSMDHFYWTLQTWLMYRLNNISAISTFLLTALAVCTGLSPGVTAFLLTAAQNFVEATHALCRQYGLLQMEFVSVERVEELLHVKQEPNGSVLPPARWPRYNGNIEFKNVTIRYAAHMDPALRDINIQIPGGSSIALVGRTGSGKSTFVQSLLAIVRAESGSILIDGIDVNKVDINVLRHRITYMAQEPVLFSGTIRDNLDPTREFTDDECQGALRRVMSSRPSWTLNTTIAAGGANLSHGERQLIGITRAILRRSAVLLLDEATASIDYKTSEEIQQILREEMRQSTVITIAHRLEAVRDVDYIIKLSEGRIERFISSEDFLNL